MNSKSLNTIVWLFPQQVDGCGQEILYMNAGLLLAQCLYTNVSVCTCIYLVCFLHAKNIQADAVHFLFRYHSYIATIFPGGGIFTTLEA